MADRPGPKVYSIAAHRGFADALVAGLAPRYREADVGLARLTLLLPSARAQRIIAEAFIRHAGESGEGGILMPRMVTVGDLDLDESLGSLLDPLGASDIPAAVDPMRRWLTLARLIDEELGEKAPRGASLLRFARETGATMDRLLVEGIGPEDLLGDRVRDLVGDLAVHWQASLRTFARVQARWLAQLDEWGAVDTATRRNHLFAHAARRWKAEPPKTPIVAAGVTSAAPALADLLRVVSELPRGAVILPDLDLSLDADIWAELGRAGSAPDPGDEPFARGDAVTHPQYHLKLLLGRMGIARDEVQPWHRKGSAAAPPERSHAISALFLPPKASRNWVDLPAERRRLTGVRVMQASTPEEEAQSIALLVRQALEVPQKRVAVVTPDRSLARRIVQHLQRWGIMADDSAGRPLSQTAAGRVLALLAEIISKGVAPVSTIALLQHPLADGEMDRREWLAHSRVLERALRGPRPREGLEPLAELVAELEKVEPGISQWWAVLETILTPLVITDERIAIGDALDLLSKAAERLCGEAVWSREDGRALARLIEEFRLHARDAGTTIARVDLADALHDVMDEVAVRPPYGGHPRVSIYGLLESRMSRAELVLCCGLNEGSWPPRGGIDALLAPPVLRALGVPGTDFRIGLSAHDLAGALGAPEVVLSRSARDAQGPTIPSRFLLRIQALLGDLLDRHTETEAVEWARAIELPIAPADMYPRPKPRPTAKQRDVPIAVTSLDRLRGDPYQFYAQSILGLRTLDPLDAEPSPAWQGEVAHAILERWHEARELDPTAKLAPVMQAVMKERNAHPLMQALWQPRLLAALHWIESEVTSYDDREVLAWERKGVMDFDGVRIHGRADRIDASPETGATIVDYKTGSPPSARMVEQGFALQLGLLGLIAEDGGFENLPPMDSGGFEYWSLAKKGDTFGYIETPLKVGAKRSGLPPEEFLPKTRDYLREAIALWIKGDEPFTAKYNPDYTGYSDYDQLMRLEEWLPRLANEGEDW